jgi:hypothetical protein
MLYEALECLFKNHLSKTNRQVVNDTQQSTNNENRINSSGSKKASFKKVLEKIRPASSSSSIKTPSIQSPYSSSTKIRISSSSNSINNLPVLYKETEILQDINNNNTYYDNSMDNFEFKPIPNDRFNNDKTPSSYENDNIFINEVDDYDDDENDSLIDKSVGGVADSIFGKNNNFTITKLKRNNSLKQLKSNDEIINRGQQQQQQSMSASMVLSSGMIKSYTAEYTDLKKLNPPKKAQLSSNINNPSPPVSARSNYEYRLNEQSEIVNNRSKFSPTPPPRNKNRTKNFVIGLESTPVLFKKDDHVNNIENRDYQKLFFNNDNKGSSNGTNKFISETEHLV